MLLSFPRGLTFLVALVIALGCTNSDPETDSESDSTGESEVHFVPIASGDTDLSHQALQERLQKRSQFSHDVHLKIQSDSSWQEIDEYIQSLMDEHRDTESWSAIQEVAGNHMIQRVLADAPDSEERNQSVDHYVSMLLNAGHRDPRAFSTAFQMLEGYWEADTLKAAIDDVLTGESCKSCARGGVTDDELQAAKQEMETLRDRLQ